MLRRDFEEKVKDLKSQKRVKVKDLEEIEKNKKCLMLWEK